MTKRSSAKRASAVESRSVTLHAKPDRGRNDAMSVRKLEDETESLATAKALAAPDFRHGQVAQQLLHPQLKNSAIEPGLGDYAEAVSFVADKAKDGDLAFASRMLAAQARSLDAIFTEMARRMALNMSDYPGATDTYARIAIKAQAASRMTIETLAKLHQPREQTVRHVHVNEGGQAVIADQFHNHGGDARNGNSIEQSHATEAAGECAALPSPDALGNGVPIPCREREAALPHARRHEPRRA